MLLDNINVALLAMAGAFLFLGFWLANDGEKFSLVLLCAAIFVGITFYHTHVHAVDLHNHQAIDQLKLQGYKFESLSTSSHRAKAIGGTCVIPVKVNKRDGRWIVSMERTDGQFKELSAQTINLMGFTCS